MRLAVISDIHGECFALDQVLQDIQRQGIEQMACKCIFDERIPRAV